MSCFISKNGLALFIQYPTLNKTNLRESAAVGLEEATRMFESRIRKTIEILQSSSQSYKLYLFYDPSTSLEHYQKSFGKNFDYIAQEGIFLDEKILKCFEWMFSQHEQVILMGTQYPNILPHHIQESFEILEKSRVVLGPVQDGSLYLFGLREIRACFFERALWNTPRICDTLFKVLASENIETHLLPILMEN